MNYILLIIQLIIVLLITSKFLNKWFFMKPKDLPKIYGENSWVFITGASSGQGRYLALKLAQKGFNIILVGSKRCHNVADEIKKFNVKTLVLEKNFNNGFNETFFNDIQDVFNKYDVSILINNIGHRTAWKPYHEQPVHQLYDTIACGTIVQSRLTQIAINKFLERESKSCIIFITAQCIHPTYGLGILENNEITVPYLSVYEATNAFGFYHANSVMREYEDNKKIDMINITPGAVITENTNYLQGIFFAVNVDKFTENIIKLMGNYRGTTCAYWGHEISSILVGLFPWLKRGILKEVGEKIAYNYMNSEKKYY